MSSPVITTGFGSFGSVNLIPTLGFGQPPGVVDELQGRIIRRGKFKLWPEWEQERAAILEEARIAGQMQAARVERDAVVAQLNHEKMLATLAAERNRIAMAIEDVRRRARAYIRKLERDKFVARKRRIEFSNRLAQVRAAQEIEDMHAIAFIIGEMYD